MFHVELDNEWGGAGRDDCFYRDAAFACGAGRISCVVSATGEVMPCTTTDLNESQGNVRDRRLSDIWAEGFAPFRSDGNGIAADCDDCWLNTRHGHSLPAGVHARPVRAGWPAADPAPSGPGQGGGAVMRWLILLFLWVVAIVVAVLILRRVRRGKPVVLAGRWSPRLVRMIAVVLVVARGRAKKRHAGGVGRPAKLPVRPADDELPKTITLQTVQIWLAMHQENGHYSPASEALGPGAGRAEAAGRTNA